jgi:hypothetical protein
MMPTIARTMLDASVPAMTRTRIAEMTLGKTDHITAAHVIVSGMHVALSASPVPTEPMDADTVRACMSAGLRSVALRVSERRRDRQSMTASDVTAFQSAFTTSASGSRSLRHAASAANEAIGPFRTHEMFSDDTIHDLKRLDAHLSTDDSTQKVEQSSSHANDASDDGSPRMRVTKQMRSLIAGMEASMNACGTGPHATDVAVVRDRWTHITTSMHRHDMDPVQALSYPAMMGSRAPDLNEVVAVLLLGVGPTDSIDPSKTRSILRGMTAIMEHMEQGPKTS